MQIAECGMQIERNRIPNSDIERPMLVLYLHGTGLPARLGLAPKPTTEFFPGKGQPWPRVTEWLRPRGRKVDSHKGFW